MTINLFQPAVKTQARARIALQGPPGFGKTLTSLKMAGYFLEQLRATGQAGAGIALIDTEGFSASQYAGDPDVPPFDVLPMPYPGAKYPNHHPLNYLAAIEAAEAAGYSILIIDSLTHEWNGKGGALELVDMYKMQSKSHDAYTQGWSKVTPWHRSLVEKILSSPLHIFATMRTSNEYIVTDHGPKKIGLAPEQRKGMEYEFTVVFDFLERAKMRVDKTRCKALGDGVWTEPGGDVAEVLWTWLSSGEGENYQAEIMGKIAEAAAQQKSADPTGDTKTYMDLVTELARAKIYKGKAAIDAAWATLNLGDFDPAKYDEYIAALKQAAT